MDAQIIYIINENTFLILSMFKMLAFSRLSEEVKELLG